VGDTCPSPINSTPHPSNKIITFQLLVVPELKGDGIVAGSGNANASIFKPKTLVKILKKCQATVKWGQRREAITVDIAKESVGVVTGIEGEKVAVQVEVAVGQRGTIHQVSLKLLPGDLSLKATSKEVETTVVKSKDDKDSYLLDVPGQKAFKDLKQFNVPLTVPDDGMDLHLIKAQVSFGMQLVQRAETQLKKGDLLLVAKDKVVEVWTGRKFLKGELILGPMTTEIKDSYWTAGRSVLCPGSSSLTPGKKHLGLDGRLRSTPLGPSEKEQKPVSLFFCVTRVEDKEEATNMVVQTAKLSITASLEMPGVKRKPDDVTFSPDELCGIPFMVNCVQVPEKTRLTVRDDLSLQKIQKQLKESTAVTIMSQVDSNAKKQKKA
jgi:hypothetical protein